MRRNKARRMNGRGGREEKEERRERVGKEERRVTNDERLERCSEVGADVTGADLERKEKERTRKGWE